jgi:hypothetical protein
MTAKAWGNEPTTTIIGRDRDRILGLGWLLACYRPSAGRRADFHDHHISIYHWSRSRSSPQTRAASGGNRPSVGINHRRALKRRECRGVFDESPRSIPGWRVRSDSSMRGARVSNLSFNALAAEDSRFEVGGEVDRCLEGMGLETCGKSSRGMLLRIAIMARMGSSSSHSYVRVINLRLSNFTMTKFQLKPPEANVELSRKQSRTSGMLS